MRTASMRSTIATQKPFQPLTHRFTGAQQHSTACYFELGCQRRPVRSSLIGTQ